MKRILQNKMIHVFAIKGFNRLLFIVILLNSCNFVFQPEEISVSKIENYNQLINAVGGVYGQFKNVVNSWEFMYINYIGDDIQNITDSEYYTYYHSYSRDCFDKVYQGLNYEYVYVHLFETIASINNVLVQFEQKNNSEEISKVIGELYFLRAYCYFRLTRTYGNIRLIGDTDVSFTIKESSFEEIYEFIEADLFKAIELLPVDKSRVDFETPHQGAAKAILAEVYLSWAGYPANDKTKYELARLTALEVMDNADKYGFSLVADLKELWDNNQANSEIVFCCFYSNDQLSKNRVINLYRGTFKILEWGYNGSGFFDKPKENMSELNFITEIDFYNNYPVGYRKDVTFFNTIYVPFNYNSENFEYPDTGYVHIDKIDRCSRLYYGKFFLNKSIFGPDSFPHYINMVGSNKIYLYRFASTLLTYAEASARSGNLDPDAFEYVNMIRRRANNVDLYSSSKFDLPFGLTALAFADSIVQERAWELAGEPEGRWFDLLRLNLIEEKLFPTKDIEQNYWFIEHQLENYFLPTPE